MTVAVDGSSRVKITMEVQEELTEHLAYMAKEWIETTLDSSSKDTITYRLSGMVHSMWSTFSGCSGGFGPSINMYPFSTEEEMKANISAGRNYFPPSADESIDINDGGLKYHSGEKYVPVPENSNPPREWDEEEMCHLLFNKVADLLHAAAGREELSRLERGGLFLRSVLDLFENGSDDFPKIMLLAVTSNEDKEFYIENGENYYNEDGTQLTGQTPSLLQFWDFYWSRIAGREPGFSVDSLKGGML